MKKITYIFLYIILSLNLVNLNSKEIEIGIDEKLDSIVDGDLKFFDADSNVVTLREIVNKPTIISLVYFNCPGICTPLLDGFADVLAKTDMKLGVEYQALSISFDHNETPYLAAKWQNNYRKLVGKDLPKNAWRFLTADSVTIKKLTKALGFYFKKDGKKDYLHAGALITLSPTRRITRYQFGDKFLPFNIKMSVVEASREVSSPTINKLLDLCFKYDPSGRAYVLNLTRIIGTVMLLTVGIFATFLIVKGRSNKNREIS